MHLHAALEKLVLDDTGVTDEVLPSLAPLLAGTLEVLSVICPPDAGGNQSVTEEGISAAVAAVGYGGRPPMYRTRCWSPEMADDG
jgi:hypothetical protein